MLLRLYLLQIPGIRTIFFFFARNCYLSIQERQCKKQEINQSIHEYHSISCFDLHCTRKYILLDLEYEK